MAAVADWFGLGAYGIELSWRLDGIKEIKNIMSMGSDS
jgi:hypothetical protein